MKKIVGNSENFWGEGGESLSKIYYKAGIDPYSILTELDKSNDPDMNLKRKYQIKYYDTKIELLKDQLAELIKEKKLLVDRSNEKCDRRDLFKKE